MNKICMGIPHTGTFPWNTMASLISLKFPSDTKLIYHMVGSCLIYEAREAIANFALNNDCNYCLFLDSDMVLPSDFIVKVIEIFDKNPDIMSVSGMAFKRTPPFQPCFYTKARYDLQQGKPILESPVEFPDTGLLDIEGMGLACCIVRSSVFSEIQSPRFFPLPNFGEDLTFTSKMRKKNFRMVVDLSIDVGHVANMVIGKDHFRACYQEFKANGSKGQLFQP